MQKQIEEWKANAEKLNEKLEEYAKNYSCKKCDRFYCSHMLRARAVKFRNQINESTSILFGIAMAERDALRSEAYSA